jgi:hypothetical protein
MREHRHCRKHRQEKRHNSRRCNSCDHRPEQNIGRQAMNSANENREQQLLQGHLGNALLLPIVMICSFFLFGCFASKTRPLTAKEAAVKIMAGEQSVSQDLQERCKSITLVENIPSEHEVKIKAAALGANVGQIIYTRSSDGVTTSMDVRFWSCPE